MRTERVGLVTGVGCPFVRYHPAVMAQAAATTALLSEGRFVFGVGAGYDHLARINAGPDPEGFFDFFASELTQELRKLTLSS